MSNRLVDERTSRRDWKRWYAALKNADRSAYDHAIQYAEGISLQHRLDTKVAAEIEISHVMLACEILGVSI